MRRVSRLVGIPVVSADRGGKLGRVADVLLDSERAKVVGIVVRDGWLGDEQVLPFDAIAALGEDAVVARTDGDMVDAREWRSRSLHAKRFRSLKGRPVVTVEGNRVGEVLDVLVDEPTGALTNLEIRSRDFAGWLVRRSRIAVPDHVRIGRDVIVIPPLAVEDEAPRDRPAMPSRVARR